MTGKRLKSLARNGNENAQQALSQAGYSPRLSAEMKEIAIETAIELFDEFNDEAHIRIAA